jgi:tetratricopeptide (TPR) repeat protein
MNRLRALAAVNLNDGGECPAFSLSLLLSIRFSSAYRPSRERRAAVMKRERVLLAGICVVLLFNVLSVHAQGVHTLQGRTISPGGSQPNNPVKITLKFNGRKIYETFTDLSGRFTFTGLNKGRYELVAEGDGATFETTSVYADVSPFGSEFTQDIQLLPKRGEPTPRAGIVPAFSQNVPKLARETLNRAKKMAEGGKADLALSLMREAIKIFPEYFEAHLELGNELLQTGHLEEAITELEQARRINPNDERTYQSFGLILMQQRKYALAVAIFAEASRLNPTNPLNPLMRAMALIHQASTIDPSTSEQAATDREFILGRAEIALAQASELSDKKLTGDHLSMAMFYEMRGERARAADELEQYLRKTPGAKNAEAIRETIKKLRAPANEPHPSSPPQ